MNDEIKLTGALSPRERGCQEGYREGYRDGKRAVLYGMWTPASASPKIDVFDKIEAKISGMYRVILNGTPQNDWAIGWNDCLDEILEVIDKYKEEGGE